MLRGWGRLRAHGGAHPTPSPPPARPRGHRGLAALPGATKPARPGGDGARRPWALTARPGLTPARPQSLPQPPIPT